MLMQDYRLKQTTINNSTENYKFMLARIKMNLLGETTKELYMFNRKSEVLRKFDQLVAEEQKDLKGSITSRGFETENLSEIQAVNDGSVIGSYGVYNNENDTIVTQILILETK